MNFARQRTFTATAIKRSIPYGTLIKNLFGSSIISYLKLDEITGTVADDFSENNRVGSYGSVSLASNALNTKISKFAPFFDGNAHVNWFSDSLSTAFNPAAGSVILWVKMFNAGVWTDATTRLLITLRASASDRVYIAKDTTDNQISFVYQAGGVNSSISDSSLGGVDDWFMLGFTWDTVADEVKAYLDGFQIGSTMTSLGVWTGSIVSGFANIGANSSTSPSFYGWLAHSILLNRAATPEEMGKVNNWGNPYVSTDTIDWYAQP